MLQVESQPLLPTAIDHVRRFLVRRRIVISVVLITGLITEDVLLQQRPHFALDVHDPWSISGVLLILSGLLLRTWAAGVLQKNENLATSGPYAITRNPLYLGSFLMMFGFCTLIGDLDNYAVMILLILLVYVPGIRSEQKRMREKFGARWQAYCQRTPMLVPRSLWMTRGGWSAQQWLKNNEHRAVFGTAVGLVAMMAWHQIIR